MEKITETLGNEILANSLSNIVLIIGCIGSIFIVFRFIYNSFAYDHFDILFQPKEKRKSIIHIKSIVTTILLSLLVVFIMVLISIIFSIIKYIGTILIILIFISIILSLIYIAFNKIKIKLKKYANNDELNKMKLFNTGLSLNIYFLSGVIFSFTLFDLNYNNEFARFTFDFHKENLLISTTFIFTFALLAILTLQIESPKRNIKYKFVGTYINTLPCELYLDYVIDNSTQILSSENEIYKAIKYLSNDSNNSYRIELYRKQNI